MAERDVVLGLVALRAERRAKAAQVVAWLALAVGVAGLLYAVWGH